jgi:hypothetical protein
MVCTRKLGYTADVELGWDWGMHTVRTVRKHQCSFLPRFNVQES